MVDERTSAAQAASRAATRGVVLILLSGVFLSFSGVLIRMIETQDPWAILFYRSMGLVVLLFSVIAVRYRSRTFQAFRAIGWNGLGAAFSLGLGFTCYLFGMLLTTVANVSFIISVGPLCAAILGWFVLRERVAMANVIAIAGVMFGMGLMFADSMGGGGMLGDIIALGAPLTFAVMVVLIRRSNGVDMLPATCLAGVIAATIGLVMSDSLVVSSYDLRLLAMLGVGQLGMGFMLITLGARYVPAAEVALLGLSESVLAPIWAWLFIAEVPTPMALLGGLIVLSCVALPALIGMRRAHRERRARRANALAG